MRIKKCLLGLKSGSKTRRNGSTLGVSAPQREDLGNISLGMGAMGFFDQPSSAPLGVKMGR